MNLCTRCFGHHHLPNDIAMCPLIDLVNHQADQYKTAFFLNPAKVLGQMIEIEIDKNTNIEMVEDLYSESLGHKQMPELLCKDNNQHSDEYPDKYFNYRPLKIVGKGSYPPTKTDTELPDYWLDNTIKHQPYSEVWDLKNSQIHFGLRLKKQKEVKQYEQIFITYGERSNSFLLVEYGFAIAHNQYDFLRVNNVQITDFCDQVSDTFQQRLDEYNLKACLRADLKIISLHRDILKLIRANLPS